MSSPQLGVSQIRILLPEDRDRILAFERAHLAAGDDMEREMQSWSARWRAESLEHYLKLGWSFGVFDGEALHGYILAQPVLFFRGLTQTLWVEHFTAGAHAPALVDTVYKWARDKRLQCVLMEESECSTFVLSAYPQQASRKNGALIELKSTRFQ